MSLYYLFRFLIGGTKAFLTSHGYQLTKDLKLLLFFMKL